MPSGQESAGSAPAPPAVPSAPVMALMLRRRGASTLREGTSTQGARVELVHSGKVRDLYADGADLIMVASDRVLSRVHPLLAEGDVALVAHAHILRVLTARWLRLDPDGGRLFRLDTGTIATLGTEHDQPVILSWNVPPTS